MRRASYACQLGVVVSLAWLMALSVSPAAEKPSVDFVAASLLNQEQACGPSLQVDYRVTGYPTSGDPLPIWDIRYIRTPKTIYIEDKDIVSGDETNGKINRFSYDRARKEMKIVAVRAKDGSEVGWNVFEGDKDATPTRVTALYSPDPLYMLSVPIYEAVSLGSIREQTELIDDVACWGIDIPGEKIGHSRNIAFVVWVDATVGLLPRRIDRTYRGSLEAPVGTSVSFSEYRELGNGVWLPSKVIIQRCGAEGTVECDVQSARAGVAVCPADIEIRFKPGTRVWDLRSRSYRPVVQ